MKSVFLAVFYVFLSVVSVFAHAQNAKIMTDQLITQYNLDFSDPPEQTAPYKLVVGSNGALYLRNNTSGSHEKISQRLNGVPAKVIVGQFGRQLYQATEDWSKVFYVSEDPDIVLGDSGTSQDIFIYDRASGQTSRVEGQHPHQDSVSSFRVSPTGEHLAFVSNDRAFGNVADNFLDSLLYVYDLQAEILTAIPAPENTTILDPAEAFHSLGTPLFTKDGNKLIYTLYEQAYGEGYLIDGYTYTLADGSYAAIENYKQDGSDSYPVQALSNSIYLFEATALNEQIWLYSFPQIYNAVTNQLLPIYPYSKENNNIKLAAVSQDERYAIFYSTLVNETEDTSVIDSAGIPLVMDTQTGEVRPALVAPRKALLFPYYGVFLYYCTYYIDDSSFYNTPVSQLPCNGFGDDPAATTHSEYISRSIKAFDLDPDNVRFHNQNRYLSFEANSWFLDNSIAYEDFDYVPNDPYTPRDPSTRRDTFVVANPFIEEPLVYGEPLIDRSIDNGWFIWREGSSWHSELVAGGTSTTYDGAIDPSAFSAITSKESIEEQYGDRFRYPSKRTEFTLKVNGPWHDGFGFISSSGNDTCVYLKRPNNAKIYLGRNRTQVTNGAVLETQMPCDIPSIKTTGRPNINRTTDNGVFVWQEQQNNWRVEVVSAAQPRLVSINVDSEKTIAAVQLINIEANDLFRVDPKELSMELNVSSPWMDGFKFNVQNGSNTCVRSWSSLMPVFVGPDRVNVGEQINLQTLSACN